MYLKRRLRRTAPGVFEEVGAGRGILSHLLLDLGWRGTAFDLNADALDAASDLNREAVRDGRYTVRRESWFDAVPERPVDLVLSCMVVEHFDDDDEARYFEKCRNSLAPGGRGIVFVPGSPRHWGVEDEIAGHYRRYTIDSLRDRLHELGLETHHLAGLTWPLSNMLLPVSNFLVGRREGEKKKMTLEERTELSGNRDVTWKTTFPPVTRLLLNEVVMLPAYGLQFVGRGNRNAMVVYAEFGRAGA